MDHGPVTPLLRRLLPLVVVTAVVVGSATAAGAHVSVEPLEGETPTVGADVTVTVRVPNERDVGTVGVELVLPEPMARVSVAPTPGWEVSAEPSVSPASSVGVPIVPAHEGDDHGGGEQPLPETPGPAEAAPVEFTDVDRLVWTGGPLTGDEVADFVVTMGPLPDTPTLVFKALQTYADGDVVRWIEEPTAADPDPAEPASVLEVAGASLATTTTPSTTAPAPADADGDVAADSSGDDDSGTPWRNVLIGVAVVLVGIGVTMRVIAQRRLRDEARRG